MITGYVLLKVLPSFKSSRPSTVQRKNDSCTLCHWPSNFFKARPTLTQWTPPHLHHFEFPQLLLLLSLPGPLVLTSSNGCSSYPTPSAFSSSEMLLWPLNAQLVPSHSQLPDIPLLYSVFAAHPLFWCLFPAPLKNLLEGKFLFCLPPSSQSLEQWEVLSKYLRSHYY